MSRNSNGHISVLRETTVTWLGKLVVLHVLCMLMWPWPRPRSRSRGFWTPKDCTSLGLSSPFWHGTQNWWLIVIVWDLVYSLSEP